MKKTIAKCGGKSEAEEVIHFLAASPIAPAQQRWLAHTLARHGRVRVDRDSITLTVPSLAARLVACAHLDEATRAAGIESLIPLRSTARAARR